MATIIGIRPSSFQGGRGDTISGGNIYYTYPLEKGEGLGAERVFMTDEKPLNGGYSPKVGDEVDFEYNRFGKCAAIHLVE